MLIGYRKQGAEGELSIPTSGEVEKSFQQLGKMTPQAGVSYYIHPETPDEARGLLTEFCSAIERGMLPHPLLIFYVSTAFRKILARNPLDASDASKALGLTSHKRGRRVVNERRDREIAKRMAGLVESGANVFDAALELADEYGLHESNVEKIYYWDRRLKDESVPF